jgi:LacI family transcriptional regulator
VLDKWLDALLERRLVAGCRTALGDDETAPPVLLLEDPQEHPRPEGKRRFFAWFEKHQFDACICLNSFILDWVRESGKRVPSEVGLAFLDMQSEFRGKAAGFYHSAIHAGMGAVDAVMGQIHRRESGLPQFQAGLLLEGKWIAGPTVRAGAEKLIRRGQNRSLSKAKKSR